MLGKESKSLGKEMIEKATANFSTSDSSTASSTFVQQSLLAGKSDKPQERFFAAKARGLKIHSQDEIERAKSTDLVYLEFWDEKMTALSIDNKYNKYLRLALEGVINASWTKRKVAILRGDVQQFRFQINNFKELNPEEKELPTMKTVAKRKEQTHDSKICN